LGELVTPKLTSVQIDTRRLGELAVDQIAAQLDEESSGEPPALVPQLVLRESG